MENSLETQAENEDLDKKLQRLKDLFSGASISGVIFALCTLGPVIRIIYVMMTPYPMGAGADYRGFLAYILMLIGGSVTSLLTLILGLIGLTKSDYVVGDPMWEELRSIRRKFVIILLGVILVAFIAIGTVMLWGEQQS